MRRAARVDRNQSDIVEGLRRCGASVQCLSAVGRGCPDLLAGFRGMNWLMEVKDPEHPPSEQTLTYHEKIWHLGWSGQIAIVRTMDEALGVILGERP